MTAHSRASQVKFISTSIKNLMAPNPIVNYEEVKEIKKQPEKLLVDVRNPEELKENGIIPGSVNIPLPEVEKAFSDTTNPETFKRKYGTAKPDKNKYLIFHCAIGKRSQMAVDIVEKLGYTSAHNYLGSFTDWAEREGLKK